MIMMKKNIGAISVNNVKMAVASKIYIHLLSNLNIFMRVIQKGLVKEEQPLNGGSGSHKKMKMVEKC